PGRSEEVEIHVVSRMALDLSLSEAESRVQQELVRLQKVGQEAVARINSAASQLQKSRGHPGQPHIEELVQAEQLEQQLKTRMAPADEGIRAELSSILEAVRDNQRSASGIEERMQAVSREV